MSHHPFYGGNNRARNSPDGVFKFLEKYPCRKLSEEFVSIKMITGDFCLVYR